MIIKVPMDKVVVAYVQSQLGCDPITFNPKKHVTIMLFNLFRSRAKNETPLAPGVHFLEVQVPDLFISQGRTYFSVEAKRAFELAMRDLLEEKLLDTIYERKCNQGMKYKQAVEYALAKFGLKEEIMPYQTLWKRVQRHRLSMESQA